MNNLWIQCLLPIAVTLTCLAAGTNADAFCGFYVSGASDDLVNDASTVVLMREGRRTVLSMQNNYEGPVESFALVVPVPQVLEEANVRTLPDEVFQRVDAMGAPRLVEYWERDPCFQPRPGYAARRQGVTGAGSREPDRPAPTPSARVRVEAQFEVAEYQIVVLSSDDSTALDTWLRANEYRIPENASELLRPYVESGMYFFAAKVDVEKVRFDDDGKATLSPLRFHYDSDDFQLPIRLGFINADGPQDLIVNILAPNQRYDVANYENATIPTNLFVDEQVKSSFSAFYRSLFDRTLASQEGSVITEYAWNAATCDPCPGATLTSADMLTLGADSLNDTEVPSGPRPIRTVTYIDTELSGRGTLSPGELAVSFGFTDDDQLATCLRADERRRGSTLGTAAQSIEIGFELTTGGALDHVRSRPDLDPQTKACVGEVFRALNLPAPTGGPAIVKTTWRVSRESAPQRMGSPIAGNNFVLTRLHAHLDAERFGEDLIFRQAAPISGGRGGATNLDKGAVIARTNQFQGRYIIRHPWDGDVSCDNPNYGVWGGPPSGQTRTVTATRTEREDSVPDLASLVLEDVAQIGVVSTASNRLDGTEARDSARVPQRDGSAAAEVGADAPSRPYQEDTREAAGAQQALIDVTNTDASEATTVNPDEANASDTEANDTDDPATPREIENVPWSGDRRQSCSAVGGRGGSLSWLLLAFAAILMLRPNVPSNDIQETP